MKGLTVDYSFSELWDWFEKEFPNYSGALTDLSIGRKDHEKGYFIENLQLETRSENSIERNKRNPNKMREILISDYKSGEPLVIAKSLSEAAFLTGTHKGTVGDIATGRNKHRHHAKGFHFKYYNEVTLGNNRSA